VCVNRASVNPLSVGSGLEPSTGAEPFVSAAEKRDPTITAIFFFSTIPVESKMENLVSDINVICANIPSTVAFVGFCVIRLL
jgi:hypothetical protein